MKRKHSNRSFGLIIGFFLLILSLYFYHKKHDLNLYLIFISTIFLILGLLNSILLTPFNKAWIKFGDLLGKFISPIILMVVYFAVIFPTKIILRIFNKDILDLHLNKEAKTYWKKKENIITSMDKQF